VTAAHVLQHHAAVDGKDLRLFAADPAVAQGQFVAGLPSYAEWRGGDGDFPPNTIRFYDNKSCGTWHQF
jgi:hypothetical protein